MAATAMAFAAMLLAGVFLASVSAPSANAASSSFAASGFLDGGAVPQDSPAPADVGWVEMSPDPSPSPRGFLPMAYDPEVDRSILFGGYLPDGTGSNETWAYDYESNTWTNPHPAASPPGGWGHSLAFDSELGRTILFGGYTSLNFLNVTWAYNARTNSWTNMSPVVAPSPRGRQGMAYDTGSDRVILFGGFTNRGEYSDETWAYDLGTNTWTNMNPATHPEARRSFGMTYDPVVDRVLLYGGVNFYEGDYYTDTWSYDYDTNAWMNLTPPGSPALSYYPSLAYDADANVTILFGGQSSETWAYDSALNVWGLLTPDPSPPSRFAAGMDYDAQSSRIVLFGGICCSGWGNDTWVLETTPGLPRAPPSPSARARVGGGIDLAWQAAGAFPPVKGYRIYRGTVAGGETPFVDTGTDLAFFDPKVTDGIAYFYRISAVNDVGEGPLSNEVSAVPDSRPPSTSIAVAGTGSKDGSFRSAVVVSLFAVDAVSGVASTMVRVDGGAWHPYAESFWLGTEGTHEIDYFSTDWVGNAEPVRGLAVRIDFPGDPIPIPGDSPGAPATPAEVDFDTLVSRLVAQIANERRLVT